MTVITEGKVDQDTYDKIADYLKATVLSQVNIETKSIAGVQQKTSWTYADVIVSITEVGGAGYIQIAFDDLILQVEGEKGVSR